MSKRLPFNLDQMRWVLTSDFKDFVQFGELKTGAHGRHIYIDNGAKVLGVAHLDTVQSEKHFFTGVIDNELYLFNAQLDDHLGAYVLLYLLPALGVNIDVLLTEGEETGNSTAKDFVAPEGKEWNWMFSFDRMGTDVVCYQYTDNYLDDVIKSFGMRPARGSFSDIGALEHLGIKGMNFGVGYYNNHSKLAYAQLHDTWHMVSRFVNLYNGMKDIKMPHVEKPWQKNWQQVRNTHAPRYRHGWDSEADYEGYNGNRRVTYPPQTQAQTSQKSSTAEDVGKDQLPLLPAPADTGSSVRSLREAISADIWLVCSGCHFEVKSDCYDTKVELCNTCIDERNNNSSGGTSYYFAEPLDKERLVA